MTMATALYKEPIKTPFRTNKQFTVHVKQYNCCHANNVNVAFIGSEFIEKNKWKKVGENEHAWMNERNNVKEILQGVFMLWKAILVLYVQIIRIYSKVEVTWFSASYAICGGFYSIALVKTNTFSVKFLHFPLNCVFDNWYRFCWGSWKKRK